MAKITEQIMSAFVLLHNNDRERVEVVQSLFKYRGFTGGRSFSTSEGTLLLYSKQNLAVENYYLSDDCSVYCIGTIVYKGLSYADSLKALALDYASGVLETNRLRGAFVIFLDKVSEMSILTDNTRMYRIYTDLERDFLSSSLMVAAALTKTQISEDAVVEQLLCGYVGGGATLIQDVQDVSFDLKQVYWLNEVAKLSETKGKVRGNKETRAKTNAKILHDYLQDVKSISTEFGTECGLSGGCDSRLVFSSVNVDCVSMKSVHTHQTSNVHDKEINVVKKLSQLYNVPLKIIPTTYLPYYDGNIDDVLRENVLYFDARNAGNIGAMSQTHTRKYKKQTSGDASLTFSGIGGEIYRNFYFTNMPVIQVTGWMESRIFEPGAHLLFPKTTYKRVLKRIAQKIAECVGQGTGNYVCSSFSKRYFDSYRIPYALGNVVNANNQMSFYLAPFTESRLIEEAKADNRYQDHCGEYEGRILSQFDSTATSIHTSRGYTLAYIPKKVSLKWKLMGLLPAFVWRLYEKRHRFDQNQKDAYAMLKSKSTYFRDALKNFQTMFPCWSYQVVDAGFVPLNNFVFTVCAVYELTRNNH